MATPKGAVVLVGGSAVGKSSMALAFSITSGYPLLADGVVALDLQVEGAASVLSLPGRVEVSQDVLDALSIPSERAPRARECVPRFWVSDVSFTNGPVPLHAVVLLGRKQEELPEILPVDGRERVLLVLARSLNRFLFEEPEVRLRMLLDASRVFGAIPVMRLLLPEKPMQLSAAVAIACEACELA